MLARSATALGPSFGRIVATRTKVTASGCGVRGPVPEVVEQSGHVGHGDAGDIATET
jgi:hypothetical protein